MTKLAIALQFYEGDKPQAMRLARMIADIEQFFRWEIRFIFVPRFDSWVDDDTRKHVAHKFMVSEIRCLNNWTGWPGGPNGMAHDLLCHAVVGLSDCSGLLMIEPDCVPVHQNWINILWSVWESLPVNRLMFGAWRNSGGAEGHINGNCIVRPNIGAFPGFLKLFNQHLAWDCAVAPIMSHYWEKTDLIQNCFESRDAKPSDIDPSAVLVHGYKDDSLYNIARERMKL